jgi:hypothetical protein
MQAAKFGTGKLCHGSKARKAAAELPVNQIETRKGEGSTHLIVNKGKDDLLPGCPSPSGNAATPQRSYANTSGLGNTSTSSGKGSPTLSEAGWPRSPPPLHASAAPTAAITTPVAWVVPVVGRRRLGVRRLSWLRRHLDASGERQHDEHGGKPTMHVRYGAIGSIRLGSLFSTLPTRGLTGQATISFDG